MITKELIKAEIDKVQDENLEVLYKIIKSLEMSIPGLDEFANSASKNQEVEGFIRRVVREELIQLLRTPVRSIVEDWKQEGSDDSNGDKLLLHEALMVLQKNKDKPEAWMNWEDFEAELDRAEAAGELPD